MVGENFQGIVLAGGKSKRFGEDKACFVWQGKTFLQHAVDALRGLGLDVCIVTQAGRQYAVNGACMLWDAVSDQGPLGGLYTACHEISAKTLLVLTCDMPLVSTEVLRELLGAYDGQSDVALFDNADVTFDPFPGIYRTGLKSVVSHLLSQKKFAMQGFLQGIEKKQFIHPRHSPCHFKNINHQQDLPILTRD